MVDLSDKRIERTFFYLLVLIGLIPVFSFEFFPTLDGPAHLYNSNLIIHLLSDSKSELHDFFIFNPYPVPNWIGHFLLAALNFFLPASIAEKVLITAYLIGLPLSFRALVKQINPHSYLISYFILPFVFSFPFLMGFYNFSLGLIFLLLILSFWLRHGNNAFSIKRLVGLALLFVCTYFSHMFIFGLTGILIGLRVIFTGVEAYSSSSQRDFQKVMYSVLAKLGEVFLAACLPLILFLNYALGFSDNSGKAYLPIFELLQWIRGVRPILAYLGDAESPYIQFVFYVLLVFGIGAVYKKAVRFKNRKKEGLGHSSLQPADYWLFSTLVVSILYFTVPDLSHSAGFISVRLGLLMFMFLILWLATFQWPRWMLLIGIILITYAHLGLLNYYQDKLDTLNQRALQIVQASEVIDSNAIILPLNNSDSWLYDHFSNYLGIEKPMVILENYEANTPYFPLKWKGEKPDMIIGKGQPYLSKPSSQTGDTWPIDYILMYGEKDFENHPSHGELYPTIRANYNLVFSSDFVQLYKLKAAD